MTNKEVAELAGVSSAAVSRFLNGGYLSDEKRARIAAAIEETGYIPSANARVLRMKKSNTVGVVLVSTDDSAMAGVVKGLQKYLYAGGYGTSVAYVSDDTVGELKAMRSMLEHQIDGIVLISADPMPGSVELFERARVPIVVVGQHTRNRNCVRFDNFGAGYELASSLGCSPESHVAYVDTGGNARSFSTDRRHGFLAGLERAGVPKENINVVVGGFTVESGYRIANPLLLAKPAYQLIACATDAVAAGILQAIRERHGTIDAPKCPRVTGFGNDPILQALAGPLPTVALDYEECGIKAAEMMVRLLKDEVDGVTSMTLGYQLIGL